MVDEVTVRHGFEIVDKIFGERYRSNRELLEAKISMVKF